MGNSSSKPSSVESHWSKRITQTKLEERRRNYSDTPDATTNALSLITGPFQQSRSPVNSIFSTNKASAPPPYSATAENTGDNRNVYAPTISKPGSAPQVSSTLEPANRSSRQARATTPHALGSQHTQVYMVPADARDVEYLQKPMPRESVENVLEILCRYDTVVIVDDSSSMKGALWNEAREALASLADIAGKYDADGIDVHFLNITRSMSNVRQYSTIKQFFDGVQPIGLTPIAAKLEELLLAYLENLETAKKPKLAVDDNAKKAIKPVNYIVLTDGVPTDDPEDVIIAAARRLDSGNFPLTQIGDSKEATKFLKQLDDNLSLNHKIRDIVDTTLYSGRLNAEILTKILLGGINRRIDRSAMH